MSLLPISVIICSRNRSVLLADAVASVLHGDDRPAECIVVDQSDAPHPTLASGVADGGVDLRYLRTGTVGVSRGRNDGVRAARHGLLAFTDDDVLVAPDWLGTLARTLEAAGPRAVATGQVREGTEEPGGFAPSTKVDERPATYVGRVAEDVLYTGNMALHRAAFAEVGPFDERLGPGSAFPAAEDNDLAFRLLDAGYRIVYTPEAVVYHRAWRTGLSHLRLHWDYGRGQGAFYAKHASLHDRFTLGRMLVDLGRHASAAGGSLRRSGRPGTSELAYMAGVAVGACQWLVAVRRRPRSIAPTIVD